MSNTRFILTGVGALALAQVSMEQWPKEHPSPLEDTCLCTPGTGTNKGQEECGLS